MRVFVTGATGFVGSHLTRLLVRDGCDVHVLVRSTSDTWRINDLLQSVHVVRGDVTEFNELRRALTRIRPEVCFHLAWCATPGVYLTSQDNLNMLMAGIHLTSSLTETGCKRLIATGTCLEYDTDVGYLSEDSRTKPCSLYAASKLALCHVSAQLATTSGMEFVWARLFHLYGPYENPYRLIPSIICALLRNEDAKTTKGEQIRDFLHVEDAAAALRTLAKNNLSGAINIGSGKPIAVREIATRIGEMLGRPGLIKLGASRICASEPMFICADNSLLTSKTTWRPQYDLEEGLRHTIAWWKDRLSLKSI